MRADESELEGWRASASLALRVAHLAGLTAFLGSILASTLLSIETSATADQQAVVFTWTAIGRNGAALTIPGMFLAILSGIALMIVQRRSPREQLWLAVKIALTVIIFANAILLIGPAEDQLRAYASALPAPDAAAAIAEVALRQKIYGAINLVLVMIVSVLGVIKPRLRRVSPPADIP